MILLSPFPRQQDHLERAVGKFPSLCIRRQELVLIFDLIHISSLFYFTSRYDNSMYV
jgi:hypothetical protein